jgi:suppressor for copper-sensitivity B
MHWGKLRFIVVLVSSLLSLQALATLALNQHKPVIVQLKPVKYFADEATFVLTLDIPGKWKVYSNQPGDTGLPFSIKVVSTDNVAGEEIIWPAHETFSESIGLQSIKTNVYKDQALIPIVIKTLNSTNPLEVKIEAVFGACEEICIKQHETLEASIEPEFFDNQLFQQIQPHFAKTDTSLLLMLVFACIGGLILNLMPCVLPILSIKVMGIIKYSTLNKRTIRLNLLSTSLGIIFSFLVLALVTMLLKNSGELIGWGFHFQHPTFIMFMIVVIMIFALDMLGKVNISLPSSFVQAFQAQSNEGLYGSFITGALATLLATPCTASFLTVSVAFALTQGGMTILLIYLMIGFGMSLPYILLMTFPNLLTYLPKPGAWMDKLKIALGVLLILTAVWLYYVLFTLTFLRTTLIFTGCLVLLRFVLSDLFKTTVLWLRSTIIITAIISSMLLPYWMNSSIELEKKINDSIWQDFSESEIAKQVAAGKVVFLDVTASWCITCKFNKFLVLDQAQLLHQLIHNNVVLMQADYTNSDRTIYKFLEKYNHQGVPLNMVFGPKAEKGIILPILLTKEEILHAVAQAQ